MFFHIPKKSSELLLSKIALRSEIQQVGVTKPVVLQHCVKIDSAIRVQVQRILLPDLSR